MPGTGQYMYMGLSLPSLITITTFEAFPQSDPPIPELASRVDDEVHLAVSSKIERSILTPSVMRYLLSQYDRCIKPQYEISIPELSNQDATLLRKLPDYRKFETLMACAIAAARESYTSPQWKAISQLCRDWANESVNSIISSWDGESLTAILLLLIYELADSSRGIAWELLDLAIRTCLQLGWHRTSGIGGTGAIVHDTGTGTGTGTGTSESADKARLMSVLKKIEGSLRMIFDRPNMLREAKFMHQSDSDHIMHVFTQVSQEIYGSSAQPLGAQSCPFTGQSATLMEILDSMTTDDPVLDETWLLFLPVCVKHKQCVFCFQEADEPDDGSGRGMKALRRKVITSASKLLLHVHQRATAKYGFVPPIVASSRALTSGCTLATSIRKRWTLAQYHVQDLLRCSEILTFFAPHWKGGQSYLEVWRTVTNLLETSPAWN